VVVVRVPAESDLHLISSQLNHHLTCKDNNECDNLAPEPAVSVATMQVLQML
jgi:hypothetical protein